MFDAQLKRLQRAVGRTQECTAGGGQFDPALIAREQTEPQFVFQPMDGLAQRGLGHVQANSGLVKVQLFSHGDELAQQAGFDHFFCSFI